MAAVSFVGDVSLASGFLLRSGGRAAVGSQKGAASLGNVDASGYFHGEIGELSSSLRLSHKRLGAIADRIDDAPELVHLLPEDKFARVARELGYDPTTTKALYNNGNIYLNRNRGQLILEDLAHEGTHALDFGPRGIFKNIRPGKLDPEQVFLHEYRAFMAEKLVTGRIPYGNRHGLIDHIIHEYKANPPK